MQGIDHTRCFVTQWMLLIAQRSSALSLSACGGNDVHAAATRARCPYQCYLVESRGLPRLVSMLTASTRCREMHSSIVDARRVPSSKLNPVAGGQSGRIEVFRLGLQVIRAITLKNFNVIGEFPNSSMSLPYQESSFRGSVILVESRILRRAIVGGCS